MVTVYDAAIIGAGADGLAAAALLARAGHKTIVLERNATPGGRCQTREFHPGFRASPYADELAPIPAELFWSLDLARHGALLAPRPASLALWPDRRSVFAASDLAKLSAEARTRAAAMSTRADKDAASPPRWRFFGRKRAAEWPVEAWAEAALAGVAANLCRDSAGAAHLVAAALAGRAADPLLAGSALHLLAPGSGGSGVARGGLGALGSALAAAAREAGAEIACGLDVTDVKHARGRARGVVLADGAELSAHAVLSTLDVKRTFLSLFSWSSLPRPLARRVNAFRMAGSAARLLLALDAAPEIPGVSEAPELSRGTLYISPDIDGAATAHVAWRAGAIAETPPLALRLPSLTDPALAPPGSAVMTVTIGAVPHRLFDGAWTHERRDALRARALAAIEAVLPGTAARIVGYQLIVPSDMEEELALTDGDMWGGEIAPDQMLGQRPGAGAAAPRTALRGLYLAGASTTAGVLATCASGAAAARAIVADFKAGLLR
jgi:phytoene dehydrogenase-like protein